MDIYKIAFVEFFLIAALGILIFGSNLKAFEYKATRFLRHARKHSASGAHGEKHATRNAK